VAGKNLTEPLYFYREFDSYRLRKYLGRQMRMMKSYARHGDFKRLVSSAFRCGVYSAANFVGMTDTLIARRSVPIFGNQQAELQKVYDAVVRRVLEDGQQSAPARDP
jgi:hypothetical protein